METVLCTPAFNNEWEFSHGYVGQLLPPTYDTSDGVWQFCEIGYQLLPVESRYVNARYDLELSVSRNPTETKNAVGETETAAEFMLDTWWSDGRDYHILLGVRDTGEQAIEHSHRHTDIIGQLSAIEEYSYMQLHLKYDEQVSCENLEGSSPSELRDRFVELLEEENKNPEQTAFDNAESYG